MALEFKSGDFGCDRGEVVDPVKVVMLVNGSNVMPCDMLQVWSIWFGFPGKVENQDGE